MNSKKVLLTAAVVSVIGAGSLGFAAHAQGGGDTLVDKISQRFNLNKDDVQKVFDEERSARQSEHQQKYEDMLNQAVKDGKLTQAQKDKVLAKHNELKKEMEQKRDEMKNKTQVERQQLMEQRRTEMDKKKAEIEQWEKDNGIPTGYLMPRMGDGPGGRGMHGHGPGGFDKN